MAYSVRVRFLTSSATSSSTLTDVQSSARTWRKSILGSAPLAARLSTDNTIRYDGQISHATTGKKKS